MCGITGFIGQGSKCDLQKMINKLVHRGPDDQGMYIDSERAVFLGHTRLAILDIDGGTQPMSNDDGSIFVVFNGEIYNHKYLRKELIALGHKFKTDHSDTEVLVHGYDEWGADLPRKLNGMFAFAVVDYRNNCLFLARDRFGEKPLYYYQKKETFIFASEMSALTMHSQTNSLGLNPLSVQKYLAYGFLPGSYSIIRNCRKLPGGTWLKYNFAMNTILTNEFWRFQLENRPAEDHMDENELIDELDHLLTEAVRLRLQADVPLGIFLSGGIDSSLILAIAAKIKPAEELNTFTIGFEEPSFDERQYARIMARSIGSNHNEQILTLDDASKSMGKILEHLDEPLGDGSILPTSLLCGFARGKVTTALSGDGSDELFAGYDTFHALGLCSLYSRCVPNWMHQWLVKTSELIMPRSNRNMSFDFKVRRALKGLSYNPSLWNPVWLSPLEPYQIADIFGSRINAEELYSEVIEVWNDSSNLSLVEQTLTFYTRFYLQNVILMKTDRASMMHSLEARAVFLDNGVVDFCTRLPEKYKFKNGKTKYLLKKLAIRYLPKRIISRPKKGFGIPLSDWLCKMPIPRMRSLAGADIEKVASYWEKHRSGKADHRLFLFSWLSLQNCNVTSGR